MELICIECRMSLKKMILAVLFSFLYCQLGYSQKVILKPDFGMTTANNLEIRKIELTDSFTILTFHVEYQKGDWIYIPKESFIQPVGSQEKLFLIKADGIPVAERYTEGIADYDLYFPSINPKTEKLDFGEANQGGSWFIYDIELNEGIVKRPLPKSLSGKWFASDGSKLLVVAFFDTVAVYNSQVWKYGAVVNTDKTSKIELKNGQSVLSLSIERSDSTSIGFSVQGKNPVLLKNNPIAVPGFKPDGDQPYILPIFQKNGKAIYKGFIRNYSERYNQKTGQVHVDNVITGNQESFTVQIQPDGSFSIEIPLCYPHQVYVQMPSFYESIFLEPGKETFHLVDGRDWAAMHQFMGDLARVNNGLMEVRTIRYFDYNKAQDTVLNSTPEQYKAYCFQLRDWELPNLKTYADSNSMSAMALQIKRYNLIYSAMNRALEYEWTYESAYRSKNKVPREKRELGIKIPKPDTSFYSFLNNEIANDPLALLSNEYNSFINRIKYLDITRNSSNVVRTLDLIYEAVAEKEIELTSEEELVLREMKSIENPERDKRMNEFYQKYRATLQSFDAKYKDTLALLNKEESFVLFHDVENEFIKRGIVLSDEEKEMFEAGKAALSREAILKQVQFSKIHGEAQQALFKKYNPIINAYFQKKQSHIRNEKLNALFAIKEGFATDLFASQDLCRGIVEEATPLEEATLSSKTKDITTPFIAEYILYANELTKEKIAKNKEKTGYYVNQTPTVESEKLFDALMAKFKGKVVLVDFWATWCGPCRSGIERIKPLKAEMEGKDVAYVYITNDSSPQGTWENMIPDIKGEHFKLTRDEWNVLSGRFNISGIPHYVLVDKNGQVANNNTMRSYDMKAMKEMLEEYLQK